MVYKYNVRACYSIEIITPKKVVLNGLWFGRAFAQGLPPTPRLWRAGRRGKAKKPKRAIIWIHGLGSSLFSKLGIVGLLARGDTAVLAFNNRGHDVVSKITRAGKNTGKQTLGGSAHEIFAGCADDIQGAINFVRKAGVRNIYLAGHSTGCQKSIYWASKKKGRGVHGIILLAPISDYSAGMYLHGKARVARAAVAARALVRQGRKHRLLPPEFWPEHIDAQRFLSLYTPDSTEEMFTYVQQEKIPRLLRSVKLPILVILAGKDEFADRPATDIAEWFERNTGANLKTLIVPSAKHSFRGKEKRVATAIKKWIVKR